MISWRGRRNRWMDEKKEKPLLVGGQFGCHQFVIFPEILGLCIIIPIDEVHHFSEGWVYWPTKQLGIEVDGVSNPSHPPEAQSIVLPATMYCNAFGMFCDFFSIEKHRKTGLYPGQKPGLGKILPCNIGCHSQKVLVLSCLTRTALSDFTEDFLSTVHT